MKKIFMLALAFSVIFTGCSSTQSVSRLPKETKFNLTALDIKLSHKLQVKGYPEQAEFSGIMKEKINNSLNASGLSGKAGGVNVMSVTVDVDYQRRFAGEDTPIPSKSVMAPVVGYTIVVKENGAEKSRVSKSNMIITKGFFGNIISVFTFGLGRDRKDEVVDIESFADHVAGQLKEMRK